MGAQRTGAPPATSPQRPDPGALLRRAARPATVLVVVLALLLAYGTVDNRWYKVLPVEGNSMRPTLSVGDVVVITPPPASAQEIREGTIVTLEVQGKLVTHRWVGLSDQGVPLTEGDANGFVDDWSRTDVRVAGNPSRLHVPPVGYPMTWLRRAARAIG